jgi:hypothetical protein
MQCANVEERNALGWIATLRLNVNPRDFGEIENIPNKAVMGLDVPCAIIIHEISSML